MPAIFQSAEGGLLLLIQSLRTPLLNQLFTFYTALGNAGLLFILVSLLLLCRRSTRSIGLSALLALALGFLCTNLILKPLVCRPRPWLDVAGLLPLIAEGDPHSFPSGHSCAAFAAGTVWLMGAKQGWQKGLIFLLSLLMALSRLYVGVHYPSDVLFGSLIGAASALIARKLTPKLPLPHCNPTKNKDKSNKHKERGEHS